MTFNLPDMSDLHYLSATEALKLLSPGHPPALTFPSIPPADYWFSTQLTRYPSSCKFRK